jgi:Kef-type K+ transport system membrane component KefB
VSGHGARPSVASLAQGLVAVAVVAAALTMLRRAQLVGVEGDALFALGFLVVAGAVAGSLAAMFGLPRLTGNLIAGILAGPQGFAIVTAHDVKSLGLLNALALALIALQAGAEITLPTLAKVWKGVFSSAVFQVALVIPLAGGAFFLAAPHVPFLHDLPTPAVAALAFVWGSLQFCRSPSVTMAVISETKAKGPLSDFMLGIVVALDVLLLPIFAAALMVARTQVLGQELDLTELLLLGKDLFASFAAGVTFGLVLALLFRFTKEQILVVIVVSYFVTWMCDYLRYDTLLVFVVAGFIVTNLTRFGKELVDASDKTSAGVMVVFFATAGAKLDLMSLKQLWPLALAFFFVRVAATIVSARIGHRVAKDPDVVKKNAWLGLVSQAGVTIGLAVVASDALPGIGKPFASLAIAVVGINELVGAVLMKWGLQRAKEIPAAHS